MLWFQVSLPLLILHGEADTVTDPSVSKALHEKACCSDKKLKLYKDAYHALLEGEPDEMIIQVFNDIISWLDERSRETNTCWGYCLAPRVCTQIREKGGRVFWLF